MKKVILTTMLICLIGQVIFSQTQTATITGKITNEKNEPIPFVTIRIKNGKEGTQTDAQGKFSIKVASLPAVLLITSTSYDDKEVSVANSGDLNVILSTNEKTLEEVTVNAGGDGRIIGKMINQPISFERVGKQEILNATGTIYDLPLLKKGLLVTHSSMNFKTYSTRGFNGSGSSRVIQLMDGMDNQAPGLNFPVGNFIGLTDLDIESIEILPGASSGLYGPGGMNGTIILNSKNPFRSPGLSLQLRTGLTNISKEQSDKVNGYHDYSLRFAKNFNNKLAFKVGVQYMQAIDWKANDSTNYKRVGANGNVIPGTRQSDPNYDGVNVYGDETSVDLRPFFGPAAAHPALQPFVGSPFMISRTGYREQVLIDPKTKNLKLNGAIHYKFSETLEAIIAGHWGKGNTVYTGNGRYGFKDIRVGQYKIELRNKNWFLRSYTTQEDAGEAYSLGITAQVLNEGWKRSYNPSNAAGSWYPQYGAVFAGGAIQIYNGVIGGGGTPAQAQAAVIAAAPQLHASGRGFADQGRPVEGSSQFNQLFDAVRKTPIPGGGLFLETSQMWMTEGQYSFKDKIKFADLIVGGNVKKYILNSKGTLFHEPNGPIKINEWGAYTQLSKKLFEDKLTVTAGGRYDKNENFEGKFTPRFTTLINVAKNNNIRLSYQTAYKFPTTQQQWLKLNLGTYELIGGLPWILEYMNTKTNATFVYNPPAAPTPFVYKKLKPERMGSFEIGYRGSFKNKLLVDMYAYFGKYKDFTGRIVLIQPSNNNKTYSTVTNSETEVKAWGAGVSLDYKMANKLSCFFNVFTDNLTNVPTGFLAGFNSPKYRINTGIGHNELGRSKQFGFNINFSWQDDFFYEGGGHADGIVKAFTTLDAQVNYKCPKIKSMIKLGATNITNKYYQTGFGNPYIGGMYYLSFAYNIL